MKTPARDLWSGHRIVRLLLLALMVVTGGCSGSTVLSGPVRTQGVVTGKHELAPKGNPKVKPRYFLWVKTEDGMVYTEVTKELFDGVKKGDDVCINCDS
ncbi:MAG: hypothetical protein ACE5K9_04685 [Candidatus Methylomirabilales bacterium]